METTRTVAWIGAFTGAASLCWNIYLKLTAGPRLRASAFANLVQVPSPAGNPHFLRVEISNVGTAPTSLSNLCLFQYESRWKRFNNKTCFQAVFCDYSGPQVPFKLQVGEQATILLQQDAKFDKLLAEGLWVGIFHSFSTKPHKVKIIAPNG
jgi:hypothetical protein